MRLWRRSAGTGTVPVWPPPNASTMLVPWRGAGDPLALPTLMRCVKLIADVACQMRVTVEVGGTPVEPPAWLRRPESFGTFLLRQRDLVEHAVASIALRGFAAWTATAAGSSWMLTPLDTNRVSAWLDTDGRPRYYVDGSPTPTAYGAAGRSGLLIAGFLTVPGHPLPVGPLQTARRAIDGIVDTDAYASRVFRSGMTSGQVLQTEQDLDLAKARAWQADWMAAHADPANPKIPVLGSGLSLVNSLVNPRDAQWIEARQFGGQEIARMFGVPASMLGLPSGDSLTYATARDHDAGFLKWTMSGYIGAIEDAWSSLLPPGRNSADDQRVRFDADPLLAPVTLDRYAAHAQALAAGWMTVDEVRATERLGPMTAPPSAGAKTIPQTQEAPA